MNLIFARGCFAKWPVLTISDVKTRKMAIASAKGKLIAVIGDEVNFHIFFVLFCLLFLYTMLFFFIKPLYCPWAEVTRSSHSFTGFSVTLHFTGLLSAWKLQLHCCNLVFNENGEFLKTTTFWVFWVFTRLYWYFNWSTQDWDHLEPFNEILFSNSRTHV